MSIELSAALQALNISLEKTNVFGYLTAQTDTTVTTAGTYYPVAGTFANPIIDNFTADATGVTYIGTETRAFKVLYSASLSSDTSSTTASLGIAVNGVVSAGYSADRLLKLTSDIGAWIVQGDVILSTGDVVTLSVTSDKSANDLTFYSLQANLLPTTHIVE